MKRIFNDFSYIRPDSFSTGVLLFGLMICAILVFCLLGDVDKP